MIRGQRALFAIASKGRVNVDAAFSSTSPPDVGSGVARSSPISALIGDLPDSARGNLPESHAGGSACASPSADRASVEDDGPDFHADFSYRFSREWKWERFQPYRSADARRQRERYSARVVDRARA